MTGSNELEKPVPRGGGDGLARTAGAWHRMTCRWAPSASHWTMTRKLRASAYGGASQDQAYRLSKQVGENQA
jgi:hypothetical protein